VSAARMPTPGAIPLGSGSLPAPPPHIQAEEQPKIAFETPGAPWATAKPRGLAPPGRPNSSLLEARPRSMQSSSGLEVGDSDLSSSVGIGGGWTQRPTPMKAATALELLGDPQGVNWKPYLIRVLASVKRNWLAVIPESARLLGRTGRVQIQFAIARDGYVPKLVIAMPSGTDALDRAAVAGVSASAPFPPLPAEFQGNQVRLQFTFSYNVK
jgi:TonB family protein